MSPGSNHPALVEGALSSKPPLEDLTRLKADFWLKSNGEQVSGAMNPTRNDNLTPFRTVEIYLLKDAVKPAF